MQREMRKRRGGKRAKGNAEKAREKGKEEGKCTGKRENADADDSRRVRFSPHFSSLKTYSHLGLLWNGNMGGDKWWYPTASGVVGGICCVYAGTQN